MIERRCGHVAVCNTLALECAGIDPSTSNGIVYEDELQMVRKALPPVSTEEKKKRIKYGIKHALEYGITSVSSNDSKGGDLDEYVGIFNNLYQEENCKIRVTMQCKIDNEKHLDEHIERGLQTNHEFISGFLKFGPIKMFSDGSLGARTALLRGPYADDSSTQGIGIFPPEELELYVQKAVKNNFSVAIHAIGDGAMDVVISAYEKALNKNGNPLRLGILHCQITDTSLLERMAESNIFALIQPAFLGSDQNIIESRVGKELASTSYAWGTMEKMNIKTAYGTDCPIEDINPILGIYAAVTRFGNSPVECVDVATAVDAYTYGSAYANFDEDRVGRIEKGKLADFVLLDEDIFSIPKEQIKDVKVTWTMLDGEIQEGIKEVFTDFI